MMTQQTQTILSGITPSGKLHLGNYFGAIHQHIRMQEEGDAFYFIANYHSLTAINDGDEIRENSIDIALDYLALGLNPNIGLFTYPILQAADILIYHSDLVPVGQDQKQNIEICRDLAAKFNYNYSGEYLKIPEEYIVEAVAVVPGIDGRKMSKSYRNTIGIFDQGKTLKKKVMSIETDSTPLEAPKDPDTCHVFALIKLFADDEKQKEIAQKYRAGGYGYGHAKKELLGLISSYFKEAREKRSKLAEDPDYVYDVLREGGRKARQRAESVMEPIREATGILRNFKFSF